MKSSFPKSNYTRCTLARVALTFAAYALLGGLFFYLHHKGSIKKAHQFTGTKTDLVALQHEYKLVNDGYFQSKLPTNVSIVWLNVSSDRASTIKTESGFRIRLTPIYNISEANAFMTLRHETCHIATWDSFKDNQDPHTQQFLNCLHRLATEGAYDGLW